MDNTINVHVPDGAPEVVIRHGDAPRIFPPRNVSISGNILAPSEFFEKRGEYIDCHRTHAIFNREAREITLYINEDDPNCSIITGELIPNPTIIDLGINRDVSYTSTSLAKRLRHLGHLFANLAEHKALISKLMSFSAEVESKVVDENDRRGNSQRALMHKVKTDHNATFTLLMPLFVGCEATRFEVTVDYEAAPGSGVLMYLVSDDLYLLMKEQADRYFADAHTLMDNKIVVIDK